MSESELTVSYLRCEYLVNPEGIAEPSPRLSWLLDSSIPNTKQVAYRICAASNPDALDTPDRWDSGWVDSDSSTQRVYQGSRLKSREQVHWQVSVRDNHGNEAVSKMAYWSMGLLEANEWCAHWITAPKEAFDRDPEATAGDELKCATPVQFRREFTADKSIRRAVLYISAQGIIDVRVNGSAITDDIFAPEWTDYRFRIQYRTYDITQHLTEGSNAVAAYLGDGWFSGYVGWQETRGRYGFRNSLMGQIEIEYHNGNVDRISTDALWKCSTGPILESDFMMGEIFDERRHEKRWDQPNFDDAHWLPAEPLPAPQAKLVSQPSEPVRITDELSPVSIQRIAEDTYLFDFAQNIAGWVRIKTTGKAGDVLTIRHGERLDENGLLYTENLRRAKATDQYTFDQSGVADWQPRFSFHGFQYVEINGLKTPPDIDTVTACMVRSATPQCGFFSCANPNVNRLWLNCLWSQKDNFLSVPTDCPQRDERLGWMGDAQVFLRTAIYNMDVAAFFTKWMQDVCDAQTNDGIFPDTAPRLPENEGNFIGLDGLGGGPAWADAGIIIPTTLWQVYGDTAILDKHWNNMVAWMDYLERTNPDGLRTRELGNNYGDWLCIPADTSFRTHSPMKNLLATAFWADDANRMAAAAKTLGKESDAQRFSDTYEKVRSAFQEEFLNPDGSLTVKTQTAYLLALAFDLVPENTKTQTAGHLVQLIEDNDRHLTTGFVGIRFLNPVLTDFGHGDLAYELLLHEDYPSWLYPVKHGATTIWERWNGWTADDGFFNPFMNSFNHYSLGSVGEWLFSHVGGIQPDPERPGFQHFILKPFPSAKLGHATVEHTAICGTIKSAWALSSDGMRWDITIPANTEAQVHIPVAKDRFFSINGQALSGDCKVLEGAPERAALSLGSGVYTIRSNYTG